MKKTYSLLILLCSILFITSCKNGQTYSDLKEAERDAINRFLTDEFNTPFLKKKITVISQAQFEKQGETTDVEKNEYVYHEKSGIYMQIVRQGCGDKIENGETLEVLTRFSEFNIKEGTILVRNDIPFYVIYNNQRYDYSSAPDKMTVERIGSSFSASFVSGAMSSFHGSAAVPAGWLVPLNYVNVGRWSEGEIAKVRLIVPHSQGTVDASSSVYPCYYEITYERVN
jgi:hypothetical protein